jgi:hypothetical protein
MQNMKKNKTPLYGKKSNGKPNDGKSYEKFVETVFKSIHSADKESGIEKSDISRNVILTDRDGCEREFDLVWQTQVEKELVTNIVECKDYKNGVLIGTVDALVGKLLAFPGFKAAIATPFHFSSGALKKAAANNIEPLIVRAENPGKDWKSDDGVPLVRSIVVNIDVIMPPKILSVRSTCRAPSDAAAISHRRIRTDHPFILEIDTNRRITMNDLVERIASSCTADGKTSTYRENFKNAVLLSEDGTQTNVKIDTIEIDYEMQPPITRKICIEPSVIGVVEKPGEGKRIVIQDGSESRVLEIPKANSQVRQIQA